MDYITTKEATEKWNISDRRVLQYCTAERIKGAVKMGNTWLIPQTAEKPADVTVKRKRNVQRNLRCFESNRL